MIRKISLIFLGAIAGAGLTLLATQPQSVFVGSSAKAASSDTYRQLNLFGDAFEMVRANYAEKPDGVQSISLPRGKLSVHEEFRDLVADAIEGFLADYR